MSVVLTTASVPDRDKFAYWHDALCRTFVPLSVVARHRDAFSGRIVTDRLGYLQVSTVESDPARVSRTAQLIERPGEAYIAVGVQVTGTARMSQDGRSTVVGRGDLIVCDTARPFCLEYPERFGTIVFQLPKRVLNLHDSDIKQVTASAIRPESGVASVLGPMLSSLAAGAHTYTAAVGEKLAGTVTDLLATLVAEQTTDTAGNGSSRNHLVSRIRQYINHNLGDPELSPDEIADAHRISIRYLHRLFEGEGITVSRLIQQRRLEECSRELARRGRVNPTVSAVARRWGFANPAHFSRAFRTAYGMSPSEWRTWRTAA